MFCAMSSTNTPTSGLCTVPVLPVSDTDATFLSGKSGISPEITENQKKAFYERNKDLFGRYFGDLFSYEEVEQIIEKRLREEVYDRLVQEILCRFDKRK